MKTYSSSNKELNEILINNGIKLFICGENGRKFFPNSIEITDEEAERIPAIVEKFAPAAAMDYTIEPYIAFEVKVVSINRDGSYDCQYHEEFDNKAEALEAYNNARIGSETDKMLVDIAANEVILATNDVLL